jgi:response regulator RpfG family c-di-GMP phosphodiesterase
MKNLSHILLVDDEPLMLSSLKGLLEFDYHVHTAENGNDALEILHQHPIKVVISDERMPHMPGHELLRQVKIASPRTIRVLLTGYADLESVIKSVNAGEIFRYLNKPCRPEMLQSVVRLGVQIYDRMSMLNPSPIEVVRTVPAHAADMLKKVSAKPAVLFVGYAKEEIAQFVEKLSDLYEVITADTVESAFEIFSKRNISVIISELNLGEYDGVDFLQTLKQERPQTVIVVLTDIVDVKLIMRAVNEVNVFKYIPKPTTQEQIERTLREATAKNNEYLQYPELLLQAVRPETSSPQIAQPKGTNEDLKSKLRAAQSLFKKG